MPDRILSVDPWSADGPGWSNAGIIIRYRRQNGEEYEETIYRKDLAGDAAALFPAFLVLANQVKAELVAGRAKRPGQGELQEGRS